MVTGYGDLRDVVSGLAPVEPKRVVLADLLPLVQWGEVVFRIRDRRGEETRVDLVAYCSAPDSRFDPRRPVVYAPGRDRNADYVDAEALVVCDRDYSTLDEALFQFRRVARLLVLHEVDETLRFAGTLPFDPHTKEREREWPGTEEWP